MANRDQHPKLPHPHSGCTEPGGWRHGIPCCRNTSHWSQQEFVARWHQSCFQQSSTQAGRDWLPKWHWHHFERKVQMNGPQSTQSCTNTLHLSAPGSATRWRRGCFPLDSTRAGRDWLPMFRLNRSGAGCMAQTCYWQSSLDCRNKSLMSQLVLKAKKQTRCCQQSRKW